MTSGEAAVSLGIALKTLENAVYDLKLRPENLQPGVGINGWTFAADEVERYRRVRNDGIARKYRWNGSELDRGLVA